MMGQQFELEVLAGSFEKTSAGRGGSKFVEAMWRIFQENTTVTYATFAEQLAQHWPRGVVHQNGPPSTARFWEEKSLPDVMAVEGVYEMTTRNRGYPTQKDGG
ncbi:g901 [Coccomyxa elongata]